VFHPPTIRYITFSRCRGQFRRAQRRKAYICGYTTTNQ
jgi:hypothetical protein